MLKHVRGIPAKKSENAGVKATVSYGVLSISGGLTAGTYPYTLSIPTKLIREIVVDQGKRISAARLITTGVGGLIWKKSEYYLVLTFDWLGTTSTVVLTGPQPELARLHAEIMSGKTLKATQTAVEFESADTPKSMETGERVFMFIFALAVVGFFAFLIAEGG